ncbi:MAG: M12 family metallo-peptidase [Thermoanaerobaculia bacterium]
MRRVLRSHFFLTVFALTASAAMAAGVGSAAAARAVAREVPEGGSLVLTDVLDIGTGESISLDLVRFDLLAPGARMVVHEDSGDRWQELPQHRYFRGTVAGHPEMRVALALHADGEMRGIVMAPGETRLLGASSSAARAAGRLEARTVLSLELATRHPFTCANPEDPGLSISRALLFDTVAATGAIPVSRPEGASHRVVYAVETDFEFRQKFGNLNEEADYVSDLLAFISTIYQSEIDSQVLLGQLSVYNTAADPWGQTTSTCALFELGRYWNANRGTIDRDATVMLSGKSTGGGVAWLGVLCSGGFSYNRGSCSGLSPATDNYGGAYAFVGNLDGHFDINSPQVVWDLVATAHEMGHNFNSPHAHCYGNILGNPLPIDGCYANECGTNCYCTAGPPASPPTAGLPGVGTVVGGAQGQGNGTIMSYCHLRSGGFSNISLTFGTGLAYGVDAAREAMQMSTFVAGRGSCLLDQAGIHLFADGYESNNFLRWTLTEP